MNEIQRLDLLIDQKIKERDAVYSITSRLSNTNKVSATTDLADRMDKYIKLTEDIEALTDRLIDLRDRRLRDIHKLNDELLIKVMYLVELDSLSFDEVGVKLGYSTRQVRRLYLEAQKNIRELKRPL